jgi:hypothetical protein
MRLALVCLAIAPLAAAFAPSRCSFHATKSSVAKDTQLCAMARRDALLTAISGLVGFVAAPHPATAKGSTFFYDEKIEFVKEESQMPTNGKVDLNSAFVVCTRIVLSGYFVTLF